jgi:outer membrane lipoprotein-sorting protein
MRGRIIQALAAMLLLGGYQPAGALSEPSALTAADLAFAKIDDYRMTIAVHEADGDHVQDRTYNIMFKKPSMERVDITSGPGKGGGVVWLGGDTVKGHKGGMLGMIHLTLNIHDRQVTTLRGDTVDTATIPGMLDRFTKVKGTVSEAPGPPIDGAKTVALTLDVADPAQNSGISREVLYLSNATYLPLRRERFAGSELVKTENVTDMKTNVGLTSSDFPW